MKTSLAFSLSASAALLAALPLTPTAAVVVPRGQGASSAGSALNGLASSVPSPRSTGGAQAPFLVIYGDKTGQGMPPSASDITGFNVYNLAFLLSTGPADEAEAFAEMSDSDRQKMLDSYNKAGIKLMVSLFGSTENPTTSGADATQLAQQMAAYVKKYNLAGVDVDYEDSPAFASGKAEPWLAEFTKALRQELPQGQYIISHAPQAPWFMPNSPSYPGGGYLKVDQEVGDLIDFYNIQYYNQGSDYVNCDELLTKSASYPGTSIFEIAKAGVKMDKLVIGKPADSSEASAGGNMDASTLGQCVDQAVGKGWKGGVMVWQYEGASAASQWVKSAASKLLN